MADAPASAPAPPVGGGPPSPPEPGRRYLREYLETLLVAILVVLFATTFVVQNSVIPSASMEETLLIGDYLLVDKCTFAPVDAAAPCAPLGQREVRRGDVIIFKFPKDPRIDYVKRVIGLPGDVIELRDKHLWRNGAPVDEPWAVHGTGITEPASKGHRDTFGPYTVPPDHYFAMGDNRDFSADSREWGTVPRENITGRALVVFWSRVERPGVLQPGLRTRLAGIFDRLADFPRRTRWSRIGRLVR